MLRLASADEVRGHATVAELRELGSGFLELSKALAPKPPPVAEAAPTAVAPRTHVIVPPAVIQQRLPRWAPDFGNRTTAFQGAVRVEISAEGRVTAAEITKSIHPAYDQLLLRAARDWLYQPAQKDGVPIPIDKTIEVTIAPPPQADGAADKSLPF
jgi:TonB family protein